MSLTDPKAHVVQALIDSWSDLQQTGLLLPNACILAAAVGVEALRYHGIEAKEEPVSLAVLNAKALAHKEAGKDHDDIDWTDGSWSVGIDPNQVPDDPNPGWNGHLVLTVEKAVLIDLTLPQVNRPHKDIILTPLVAPLRYESFRAGEPQGYDLNGCLVEYQRRPDLASQFRSSPDWTRNRKTFTPAILDRMAVHLSEKVSL